MKILAVPLLIMSALIFSCRGNASEDTASFPYPDVPGNLVTPQDRASYLIRHFWDNVDFADSIDDARMAMLEQGFADFISVFGPAEADARREAMQTLVRSSRSSRASADVMDGLAESYLYSPESPVYDEEYFILYLDALLQPGVLDDVESVRPRFLLDEASRNRVGAEAADFALVTSSGERSLGEICSRTPYTLLIFVDPECETCAETVAEIDTDPVISSLVSDGTLGIVGVYGGDDDALWESSGGHYPGNWTVGKTIRRDVTDGLYAVATYPTLYLLDSKGIVVQKNTNLRRVLEIGALSR